jgi:hypothetical protein
MRQCIKHILSGLSSGQAGQALIIVLIFLVLGSLTLVPTLSHIMTSLKTGEIYEEHTNEIYAADAGVEDAIWQIKYDRLGVLFGDTDNFAYIFGASCSYELDDPMNDLTTNVTIENVWLPTVENPYASPTEAKAIVECNLTDNQTNRLVVTDTALDDQYFRIKIDFYPAEGETNPLEISSIGIWIPHGFSYVGPSSLEAYPYDFNSPTISPQPGGQAVVWDFSPPAEFDELPLLLPTSAEITFEYSANVTGNRPAAVAWVVTSGALAGEIPMVWDIDTKIYKVISTAGGTTIEAYPSRCDIRQLGGAFPGDYLSIGKTLMRDVDLDVYERREVLDSESTSSTKYADETYRIPMNATVVDAYLYWSGWFMCDRNDSRSIFWSDTCSNLNNWTRTGTDWYSTGGYLQGHYDGTGAGDRELTLTSPVSLSGRPSGSVVVGWQQWESNGNNNLEPLSDVTNGDALQYQLYNGTTWGPLETAFQDDIGTTRQSYYFVLPDQYLNANFKIRFYLHGFTATGEDCRIDDIHICSVVDSAATFKIDNPDTASDPDYSGSLSALDYYVLENAAVGEYSYACVQRVKTLLLSYSVNGTDDNPTGNGIFTVGDVIGDTGEHWSYAAWSLIIIYSSPETAGHQIYLFDRFAFCQQYSNLDFDFDGEGGGDISGFIIPERIGTEANAATISCFVGEGDKCFDGDFIALNAPEAYRSFPQNIPDSYKLWDGITLPTWPTNYHNTQNDPNNVWNARSRGTTEAVIDGFDIDTFYITWESGFLHADDTSMHIDIYTEQDNWNLIYIIMSVRSKATIGGTTHDVIHGG